MQTDWDLIPALRRFNLIIFVIGFASIPVTEELAVMSIDLGCEWMKIAIVSPGVPMEIALNSESKRKTPVVISFRDNEREIGDPAQAVGVRFPESTYTHLLELLGKTVDNPMVEVYKKRFPHHKITKDSDKDSIVLEKNEILKFTPEELMSMILNRAREIAQKFADQPIKDAVVTVPVFFNQAERRALARAADLANLKILQIINDNTAVALNYGIFRRKDFNSTIQRIMFYDMGACSTTATIVGYQTVKTKDRGYTETNPQLTVLGIGFDRTLGGLEFTLRLRHHLGKLFNEQKKTPNDVFKSPRALSKLFKESERVKMVLSANADHIAQVEGLLDDKDFRAPVTRAEFEDLCTDLFERVRKPVDLALKNAAMTMDDIDQVILVGAGTRIPKVQEKLLEVVNKPELGKSLNTDEAAAMGAVYQAAHLSQGFKVKKFLIKDAVLFPIQVDFERELEREEGPGVKVVSRTLFGGLNVYPQKKVMTFTRHVKDFAFNVNYGDISSLPEEEIKRFGSRNISRINLSGVQAALSKHSGEGVDSKGVKAHFRMDDSGLLQLELAESVFEKKEETEENDSDTESTLSKLGSTISKLFSAGSSDDTDKAEASQTEEKTENKSEDEENKEEKTPEESSDRVGAQESKSVNESENATNKSQKTPEESSDKLDKKQSKSLNASENATNNSQANTTASTDSSSDAAQNETKKLEKKSKIVIIKEPLTVTEEKLDFKDWTKDQEKDSKKKIEEFNKKEQRRKDKEESKNNLESFILDTQDKLYQQEFEVASKEDERERIREQLSSVSDWLYEEEEAEAKVYREKLNDLHSLTKDLYTRVKEHKDRPEALNALNEMLNMSSVFLSKAKNLSKDDQYFSEVELETLDKLITETKQWKETKEAEQKLQPLYEMPKMTVRSIAEKIGSLDREVKYLVNKARFAKPKTPKTTNETDKKDSKGNDTAENETKSDSEPETTTEEIPDLGIEIPSTENQEPTPEDILELDMEADNKDTTDSTLPNEPSKTNKEEHTEL